MPNEKQSLQYHPEVAQEAGALYKQHGENAVALITAQEDLKAAQGVRLRLAEIATGGAVKRLTTMVERNRLESSIPEGLDADGLVGHREIRVEIAKSDIEDNIRSSEKHYRGDKYGNEYRHGKATEYYDNALIEASQDGVPIVTPEVAQEQADVAQEQADAAKALTGPMIPR